MAFLIDAGGAQVDMIRKFFSATVAEDWRKFVPSIILENPELSARLIQPTVEVNRISDPRHLIDKVELSILIDEPKNFQSQPHIVSCSVPYDKSESMSMSETTLWMANSLRSMMEEYRLWLLRNVAGVPDGVLAVWDCEILPRESAKVRNLLKGEGKVRPKLGVLLMEDENGAVSVQLFQDTKLAKESFDNLTGRAGDPPSRATMLSLDYEGSEVDATTKNLPLLKDRSDEPDMHVLGTGPVKFKDGWEEEVKEAFKPFTQGRK
jgi:hypothetical protein